MSENSNIGNEEFSENTTQTLNKMAANIADLKDRVTKIENILDARAKQTNANLLEAFAEILRRELEPIKQEIQQMKQEMQEMKQEIQQMKQEIQQMKQEMQEVKQETKEVKEFSIKCDNKLDRLEIEFKTLRRAFHSTYAEVTEVQDHLVERVSKLESQSH